MAALVVETALRDMLAQADAVDAAAKAQCDHHTDHDVSVAVDVRPHQANNLGSLTHRVSRRLERSSILSIVHTRRQ